MIIAMMMVIAGDYKDKPIQMSMGKLYIAAGFGKSNRIYLNGETIETYEVVGEDTSKNLGSSLVKGAIGGAILGPAGAVAGALAGSNSTNATLKIYFKDGKKSLIKVNGAAYQSIMADCFKF